MFVFTSVWLRQEKTRRQTRMQEFLQMEQRMVFMENFSQSAPVNMAPTGIATFAKCPICPDIRQIQADIAVIGAPCDMAIQGRPGARLGPRGIRTQSTRFRFSPQGS